MDTALVPKWDMLSLAFWSYAPHNLRHLRQPVPKDASAHIDASIFTFDDAFEDLLALSQGQGLPNINLKYEQRKLLNQVFPRGEPVDFWLQRLQSQGLVANANRFPSFSAGFPTWVTGDLKELDKSQVVSDTDEHADNSWNRLLEDLGLATGEPKNKSPEQTPASHRDHPDHFEEMFSALESAFTTRTNSWDTFVKAFGEDSSQAANDVKNQPDAVSATKEVVEREEHVDRFGYLHSKVTTKTLDADGRQIGTSTHYSMRPASKEELDAKRVSQEIPDEHSDRPVKRIGWFWK